MEATAASVSGGKSTFHEADQMAETEEGEGMCS